MNAVMVTEVILIVRNGYSRVHDNNNKAEDKRCPVLLFCFFLFGVHVATVKWGEFNAHLSHKNIFNSYSKVTNFDGGGEVET